MSLSAINLANSIPLEKHDAALLVLTTLRYAASLAESATPIIAKPVQPRRADLPESTDNLTLPANTDQQKVADCRAALVKEIWQADNDGFVDLSPQLVDRIVYAVVRKMTGWKRVLRQIKRAKNRVDEYKKTDGKKGVETLWMALGKWCKELYESNGVAWIPVAGGQQEPEPACAQATAKPIVKLPSDEEEEQYPEMTEEERAKLKAFEDRMRARYAKEHAHKEQEAKAKKKEFVSLGQIGNPSVISWIAPKRED